MNLKIKAIIIISFLALTISCKKSEAVEESVLDVAVDSAAAMEETISSSAAVVDPNSDRKFVRTADLKFKVKNVVQSTNKIEDATIKFGGFVTQTTLQSSILSEDRNKVSSDSTLLVTKFLVENSITIRVPNTKLDTIIKTIAKQIEFLNHRIIKADDVTLQMLSNKMAQKRSQTAEERLANAIDKKGQKMDQIVDAENQLDQKKEQNDSSKLQNLSLEEQINFSTINIFIYQNNSVRQEVVPNTEGIAYKPHLGIQLWESIKSGWHILEGLIIFLIRIWPLYLLWGLVYFGYKKYKKN